MSGESIITELFVKDVKKDFDEVFARLRDIEIKTEIQKERDTQLLDKMEGLKEFFADHDKHEMEKYTDINNSLEKLKKFMYIATGVFITIQVIGLDTIIQTLTKG